MARMTGGSTDTVVHLAALEQRVSGLESGVNTILQSVNSLAAKVEERGRPQWQAYSVLVAVLGLLGAFAYWPIREQANDLKTELKDMRYSTREELRRIDRDTLSRDESAVYAKMRDQQIDTINKRLDRIEGR